MEKIGQPPGITRALLPHQLRNIYHMEKLEKRKKVQISDDSFINTKVGVLGDKPGYGKSMCIVGLICRDRNSGFSNKIYKNKTNNESNDFISVKTSVPYTFINCNIVLCPKNIINQWKREFAYSDLRISIIIRVKDIQECNPLNYDVIIVSPGMYNKFISRFESMCWKRFVYDEPSCLKIASMKLIESVFYWFISGTPEDIKNYHWACKSFIKDITSIRTWFREILKNITIENSEEELKNSFSLPETIIKNYQCYNRTFILVSNYTSEIICKMLNAGNIREAIKVIGGEETDNLFEALLKGKKLSIDKYTKKIQLAQITGSNIDNYEKNIKKLEDEIVSVENKYKEMLKYNCIICYESLSEPVLEKMCGNLFCGKCLLAWIKDHNSCPVCRREISSEKSTLLYVNDGNYKKISTPEEKDETKDKPEMLLEIVKKDGKFLIFSEWDETFVKISKVLTENKIPYMKLSKINTEKHLNIFARSSDINILLINYRYNGVGLNIQFATDIVFYHRSYDSIESQAIGRANRIGRTEPLTIHYLNY